jgi:hypothetical protein
VLEAAGGFSAPLGAAALELEVAELLGAALDCAVSVPLGVVEVTGGLLLAVAAVSLLAVELVAPAVADGADAAALGLLSGVVVVVVVVVLEGALEVVPWLAAALPSGVVAPAVLAAGG